MMPPAPGVGLTYDDFVAFPDDGQRHELIDGAHHVTPSSNARHQQILINLTVLVAGWLERHPVGRMFIAPFDVLLSPVDIVEPDLLYISNERLSVLTAQNVQGAPDLVVEIASPATRTRDATLKRDLYERWGVTEYWRVDPERQMVFVYRRDGSGFGEPEELRAEREDSLETPVLRGLTLPLARIFHEPPGGTSG